MDIEAAEGGPEETSPIDIVSKRYVSPREERQIEIMKQAQLAAMREIAESTREAMQQAQLGAMREFAETTRLEEERLRQERQAKIGFYKSRRDKLMLFYSFALLFGKVLIVTLIFTVVYLSMLYFVQDDAALLATYLVQFLWAVIAMVIVLGWHVVHTYLLWSTDWIYADINEVYRHRNGVWFFGIRKLHVSIIPKVHRPVCTVEQSKLEQALEENLHLASSSTVTIDTDADRDKLMHDMKYVRQGHLLKEIIDAST